MTFLTASVLRADLFLKARAITLLGRMAGMNTLRSARHGE